MLTNGAHRFFRSAFSSLGQQKIALNGYVHSITEERSGCDDSVWGSRTMHSFAAVCTLPLNKYVMSQN
jgi:hypothetical protein